MLILTANQMLQVRVQYNKQHLIRPRLLADGTFAVSENVLTDPYHSQVRSILEQGEVTDTYASLTNNGSGEYLYIDGKLCTVDADTYSWSIVPTSAGHKFKLIEGDYQRSEFVGRTDTFGPGDEVWQAFTFELNDREGFEDVSPPPSWGFVAQWHAPNTDRSPVLYYDCGNDSFRIVTRSDDLGPDEEEVHYTSSLPEGPMSVVTRFIVGEDGELQVWLNGVEVVNVDVSIGFYEDSGDLCYLQWGNYHQPEALTSSATVSNMRWGFDDLSSKINNPDPI